MREHVNRASIAAIDHGTLAHATVFSSLVSLCASAMGSGVISLGHAFADTGIFIGGLIIIGSAVCTDYSLRYLVNLGRSSGERSYEGVARHYLGVAGERLVSMMLIVLLFGFLVLAMIIVMDLLPPVIGKAGLISSPPKPIERAEVGAIFFSLIFPLTQAKTLDRLRFTSGLGVCCVGYLVVSLLIRAIGKGTLGCMGEFNNTDGENYGDASCFSLCGKNFEETMGAKKCYFPVEESGHEDGLEMCHLDSPVRLIEGDPIRAVLSLPLIIMSFICQFNIFQIDSELRLDLKDRMNFVIRFAIYGVVMNVYLVGGFLGYALNGACVSNNLLKDMEGDPLFTAARTALSTTNLVKIPLYFLPMRNAVNRVAFGAQEPTRLVIFVESLLLYLAAFGCAVALGSVSKDLNLIGSTTGCMLIFVLPGVCYLSLLRMNPQQARQVRSDGGISLEAPRGEGGNALVAASNNGREDLTGQDLVNEVLSAEEKQEQVPPLFSPPLRPLRTGTGPPKEGGSLPAYVLVAVGILICIFCFLFTLIFWSEA